MALPQPQLLAGHLHGAAEQCQLLGNQLAVKNAEVLTNILDTFKRMETRMTAIENGMTAMKTGMETKLTAIETGMAEMETIINSRMDAIETRLGTRMDALYVLIQSFSNI